MRFPLLGLVLAAVLAGCSEDFRPPVVPRASVADGVLLAIEDVRALEEDVHVGLRVERADPGVVIHEVLLADRDAEPCIKGDLAETVAADGVEARDAPVRVGTLLDIGFSIHPVLATRMSGYRLDVLAQVRGQRRCIPLEMPSSPNDAPSTSSGRAVLGLSAEAIFLTSPLAGSFVGFGAHVYGGAWAGPARILGGTGLHVDACDPSVCGTNEDGRAKLNIVAPLSLSADIFPLSWSNLYFGIGARYSFVGTFHESLTEGRRFGAYQTLALTPRMAATRPRGPNAGKDRLRSFSVEVEVPIGVGVGIDEISKPALQVGLSLMFFAGL
jgi:hypothetical protein